MKAHKNVIFMVSFSADLVVHVFLYHSFTTRGVLIWPQILGFSGFEAWEFVILIIMNYYSFNRFHFISKVQVCTVVFIRKCEVFENSKMKRSVFP